MPSFSYNQVKKTLEEELGKPITKVFKSFSKKPIASASIAQVHKAVLKNGDVVAVKVLRPNVKEIIDTDLDILFFIAHYLEKHFKEITKYRPVSIVKEFAFWTRKELNFEVEKHNAKRLKEEFNHNSKVYIPKIYDNYSSKKILVMEFIDGIKIDDFSGLKKLKINRKKVAKTYFLSILEQALIHGFFQADPHPANIFVRKNGSLVYLDYGIVGELSSSDRKKIISFIRSIPEENSNKSLDILISLASDTSNADLEGFKKEALPILQEVYYNNVEEKGIGEGFYNIISLGANYAVIFDPSHVLMAKAVYQGEGLGMKLDPKFKIAEKLKEFADIYLKTNYSPTVMVKRFKDSFLAQKNLLLDLPEHVSKIIKRIESPQDNSQEIAHLKKIEEQLAHNSRRRNEILLIVSLFGLAIFLFVLEGHREVFGLPLSGILFILGAIFSLFFIITNRKKR